MIFAYDPSKKRCQLGLEWKEIKGMGKFLICVEEQPTELTDESSEEKRGIKSDS